MTSLEGSSCNTSKAIISYWTNLWGRGIKEWYECSSKWSSPFFLQGISCIEAHPLHVCHPLRTRKGNYKAFEFHVWKCMMVWSVWVAVSKLAVSRKASEGFIKRELLISSDVTPRSAIPRSFDIKVLVLVAGSTSTSLCNPRLILSFKLSLET